MTFYNYRNLFRRCNDGELWGFWFVLGMTENANAHQAKQEQG